MNTRHILHVFTLTSTLAAACLLVACSGGSQPSSEAAGSTASVAVLAASTPVAVQPVAFIPDAKAGAFTQCNIEVFDHVPFQAAPVEASLAASHSIAGWLAKPHATHPTYWLRLEDKAQGRYLQVPLVPTIKRTDVVAAEGEGDAAMIPLVSGFALKLPGYAVAAGHYHAYVAAIDDNGTSLCDNGRYIDFK